MIYANNLLKPVTEKWF